MATSSAETEQYTLIRDATVLSMDHSIGDFISADILIRGSIIADIKPSISPPAGCQTTINAKGCIVIPGFVDCHRHSWEALLRTVYPNSQTLDEYLQVAKTGFGPKLRPHDVFVATRATALAAIDAGITTVVDNMHCNNTEDHAKAAVKAWVESGLDAIVALEPAPWGAPVPSKEEIKQLVVKNTAEIPQAERARVEVGIFAHLNRNEIEAGQEVGAKIIHEIMEWLDQGLLKADDEGWLVKKEGGSRFIFNHATSMADRSWKIIKKLNGGVNICPRSDSQWSLAGGFCAWDDALAQCILPGISIDNELAYGGDMFSEMKVLFYTQRALAAKMTREKKDDACKPITVREVLAAATVNGAQAIGKGDQVGRLAPGMAASMVLLRADGPSNYPALSSVGQVVLSTDRSNVDTVIARGKILKRDGRLTGLDWEKIKREMDECLKYLKTATGYEGSQITESFKLANSS